MVTLGNKINSAAPGFLTVAAGTQIATSESNLITIESAGWLTRFGVRAKALTGSPTLQLAGWLQDGSLEPSTLLGSATTLSVGVEGDYSGDITNSITENEASIRVSNGNVIQVGGLVLGGSVAFGTYGSGLLPYFTQSGLVSLSDPFSKNGEGVAALTFYAEFTPNTPPNAPTGLTPAHNSTANDFSPNFSAIFSDPEMGAPYFDRPSAIEFQARRKDTGAMVWSGASALFLTTPSEQEDGAATRTYAGTSLVGINQIEWRVRFYDLAMSPGAWSGWLTLTINQGPVIALTSPVGKIDGPTEDIGITGTYTWGGGDSELMQARILQGTLVWRESPEIPKVVASGGTFTLTGAELAWGELGAGLALQAQVRATDGEGWGAWSPPISFSTNAIPTAPSNIQPPTGTVSALPPTVTFQATDLDDVEGSEAVGRYRITRPDGNEFEYDATSYNATTGEFSRTFDSDAFPDEGAYIIECWLDDVSASDGKGPESHVTFFLQGDLGVTIVSPAENEVLEDSTPPVVVSLSSGVPDFGRYILYDKDGSVPIYDSNTVDVAGTTIDDEMTTGVLVNGRSYDLRAWVLNDEGKSGWSNRRQFSVSWTAQAAPDNFTALPYRYPRDPEATSAKLVWTLPAIPLSKFHSYEIWRWKTAQGILTAIKVQQIFNIGQNSWIDAYVPANGEYSYALKLNTKGPNGGPVYSESALAAIDIPLSVVVIQDYELPQNRLLLRWKPSDRKWRFAQEAEQYKTHGRKGLPIVVFGTGTQFIFDGSARIISDENGDRNSYFEAGVNLYTRMRPVHIKSERMSFLGQITNFELDEADTFDVVRIRIEQISGAEGLD